MKKLVLLLTLICFNIASLLAQEFTLSYGCVGISTSMGPQAPIPGQATWIEFYDDYILVMGYEKFTYGGKNLDGSMKFWATKQGPPAMNTIGWVVSKDYSSANKVVESKMMGMTAQMVYQYQFIGEGSKPAQRMMGASSFQHGYDDEDDSSITCHSCHGNGACKYCHGSGRYAYSRDGRCGVCRGTGRCAGCNGKGNY